MLYAIVYPFSDRDLRHRSLDLHVNPLSLYNEANPYLLILSYLIYLSYKLCNVYT